MAFTCWCKGRCPHGDAPRQAMDNGNVLGADRMLRRSLIDAPDCPIANALYVRSLIENNRAAAAWYHVPKIEPESARAYWDGRRLRALGLVDQAVNAFRSSGGVDGATELAGALEARGDLDESDRILAAAEERFGPTPEIRRRRAINSARRGQHENAIGIIGSVNYPGNTPLMILERGRYLEKVGEFDNAWSNWMEAKRQLREQHGQQFREDQVRRMADGLHAIAGDERLHRVGLVDAPGPQPIFILGYPRSGTTMVEQALTAHPSIAAGDELQAVFEIADFSQRWLRSPYPYPQALLAIERGDNAEMPEMMRDYYLRKAMAKLIESRQPIDVPWFTDKMPLNEVHLLLLVMLFPQSPKFYVRRHPLDIMVSNMSHYLTHGWFNALSLETCAYNYWMVDGLLQTFKRQLPGQVIEVRYESFVANHIGAIDAMLDVTGLVVDPACYDFHLNARHSRTLSYSQVQQPLYDSSVGRYKPFLKHLAPAVEILRPIIEREGYEI